MPSPGRRHCTQIYAGNLIRERQRITLMELSLSEYLSGVHIFRGPVTQPCDL